MKQVFFLLSIMFISVQSIGQDLITFADESKLVSLLDDLRAAENNKLKAERNELFKSELSKILDKSNAMDYPFSRLQTVGFIDSPDKKVRIINWNVEQDDQTQRYYGFVLHVDKRKDEVNKTELIEDVFGMKQPEDVVTADQWYGALYYKIIPVKKGSRTIYTVLGWDGNTTLSNIKLIDAMYISGSSVKFGTPLFKIGKETKKRLFYEHSEKTTMILRYEEDRERIMMDHLSPESPSMKGFYSFYVPDLSYDALKFEKGKWILYEDVIGVNDTPDQKKQTVYVKDPKTGQVVEKKVDAKWQNPEDPTAPAGGIEHVAVTPDQEGKSAENADEVDPNAPKINKKDKRDPNNLTITNGMSKKKRRKRKKGN